VVAGLATSFGCAKDIEISITPESETVGDAADAWSEDPEEEKSATVGEALDGEKGLDSEPVFDGQGAAYAESVADAQAPGEADGDPPGAVLISWDAPWQVLGAEVWQDYPWSIGCEVGNFQPLTHVECLAGQSPAQFYWQARLFGTEETVWSCGWSQWPPESCSAYGVVQVRSVDDDRLIPYSLELVVVPGSAEPMCRFVKE
jgi:hypothetical protein